MTYTFCTLFDKNYLYKGLVLYRSLAAHCSDFTLWILCMDEVTYSILTRLQLERTTLVALEDFENEELRQAKQDRTAAEYCWTCTAPLVLYVMEQDPEVGSVVYLDADLFFFSDPRPIYDEMSDQSILIIEHRYAPEYQNREGTSGIYNVSMVIFRNDKRGMECLSWWKQRCLELCTLDPDAGHCGDQKYLDDWPSRFENVAVLQHKGGGLAPWNISNYRLSVNNGSTFVDADELIFYHFHSLQIIDRRLFHKRPFLAAKGYRFTDQQLVLVYKPYARALSKSMEQVGKMSPHFPWGCVSLHWRDLIREFRSGNVLFA